jgi:hypothetical protein
MILVSGIEQHCFSDTIPNIPFFKQEKTYWCWAVTSQILLKFFVPGFNKTQTQIANTFGINNGTAQKDTLVKTKIPLLIDTNSIVNGKKYLTTELISRALTWAESKVLSDNNCPFTIIYHYPGSTAKDMYHCVIFGGYTKDSTKIKIVDPDRLSNTDTYVRTYLQLTTGNILTTLIWQYTVVTHTAVTKLTQAGLLKPSSFSMHLAQKKTGLRFSIPGENQKPQNFGISVLSMNGKTLWESNILTNQNISLPFLSAGNYLIHAQNKNMNLTKQFILSK